RLYSDVEVSRYLFFFSSRRRHTRCLSDWSSDVCSSDLSPHVHFIFATASPVANLDPRFQLSHHHRRAQGAGPRIFLGERFFSSQIGRASCRERVEISDVDVVEKKIKNTPHKLSACRV